MSLTKNGDRLTAVTAMLWGAGAVLLAFFVTLSMSGEHIIANAAWWVHADIGAAPVHGLVVVVGVLTMVAAWLLLSRVPRLVDRPYWLLGAFAVVMLMMPPLFSTDVYAYFEAGWVQAQHLNPYTTPVGSLLRQPDIQPEPDIQPGTESESEFLNRARPGRVTDPNTVRLVGKS